MTFPMPFHSGGIKYAAPGSQSFTTVGTHSFVIPRYKNSLTITLWGGGGGGATNAANGANGGASTIAALSLSAGGGGLGHTGGAGVGGTASGGTTNNNGSAGSGSSGGSGYDGLGGGGAGGYYTYTVSEGPYYTNGYMWLVGGGAASALWGNPNSSVGDTSSGATSLVAGGVTYYRGSFVTTDSGVSSYYISRSYPVGAYGYGGGAGARVIKSYAKGVLTPASTISLTVGGGGAGGGSAGAGVRGQITFSWT